MSTLKNIASLLSLALLMITLEASPAFSASLVHHELRVQINPVRGTLTVQDSISLPSPVSSFEFQIHGNLKPQVGTGIVLEAIGQEDKGVPMTGYRVHLPSAQSRVTLTYQGEISDPLIQTSGDYAQSSQWSPGIISKDGVFLGGSSAWYPLIGAYPVSFSMRVDLPPGWTAVSQGQSLNGETNTWQELAPQDEIYLIAGQYHLYQSQGSHAQAQVYLRQPDTGLADRYLRVTEQYIDLYSRLIGEYPYDKFALVENFWQTGYGMPSFTLLGSKVIRLPFIPYTSYPHEILHNWWGNAVYVDYTTGNWAEGLTSYLADHLLKEQRGAGVDYRRDALQRYADSVSETEDFPLKDFRGRHNQASQAIGYGKTLMFFHMLRRELGDQIFIDGLRGFYHDYKFRLAGYQDLQLAFEKASGKDLSQLFQQWTSRTGLPELEITATSVSQTQTGYELLLELSQAQPDPAFVLRIPILIQMQGKSKPLVTMVQMTDKKQTFSFKLDARPLRLAVDPQFDVARRLDPSEIPASLAQLFGAEKGLIITPSKAKPSLTRAYSDLARQWASQNPGFDVRRDDELKDLPDDRALWLFGRQNHFRQQLLNRLPSDQIKEADGLLVINGQGYSPDTHSFAMTSRLQDSHDSTSDFTLGWLSADSSESLSGLARKLPHYGKYSYVVFQGDLPTNRLKGQWQLGHSAMQVTLPGGEATPPMTLPRQDPLAHQTSSSTNNH